MYVTTIFSFIWLTHRVAAVEGVVGITCQLFSTRSIRNLAVSNYQ